MAQRESNLVVVGGGIMGGDIAYLFAAAGWQVDVVSPSQKTRDALPGRIESARAGSGSQSASMGRVASYATLEQIDWPNVDLVIEAVSEDLALKQQLFAQIESLAGPDIPLASNTSNFQISEVGKLLGHRQRLVGLHFFMPAHLVPLVEVISSDASDPEIAQSICRVMEGVGKKPIWVKKDIPGFVGNRIQHAMMREALYLVDEGVVSAEDVDIAVRFGFGFRFIACGPMLQKEMSGWDTNCRAGNALYPHLHNEAVVPPGIQQMVENGRKGMKSLHGLWPWTEQSVAAEKARIEGLLLQALALLRADQ